MSITLTPELLTDAGLGSFFRPRDVAPLGISHYQLQELVRLGHVGRIARGLYRLEEIEPSEHYTLAAVAAAVPTGIVCLLSALSYHRIGTQLPRQVWLAIAHRAFPPHVPEFPVQLVRFSGASLSHGVQAVHFEGVPARITSPARTVVDCFRFRRLVGEETALEALRESLHESRATTDQILYAAKVCRALSLVEPALKAMSV